MSLFDHETGEVVDTLIIPESYTKTGLLLSDDMDFDTWQAVGQQIQKAGNSVMWWLGDWWNFGDRKYGELAAQAADSDFSYQTIKAAGWVSRNIEMVRRRTNVEWTKHREVAALDPEGQDEILERAETEGLTVREVRKAVRDKKALLNKQAPAPFPPGKYRVIYADPPWQYGDERNLDGYDGTAASKHYPTMPTDEICSLGVSGLAADNSVLFCWATFPLLPDALKVVESWGFQYKTALVWAKGRPNLGNYHNASAELLIIATNGSCTPDLDTRIEQVQQITRTGRHSEKPEEFRALIDTLYETGPRIELFRRGGVPDGWTAWGNEAEAT